MGRLTCFCGYVAQGKTDQLRRQDLRKHTRKSHPTQERLEAQGLFDPYNWGVE